MPSYVTRYKLVISKDPALKRIHKFELKRWEGEGGSLAISNSEYWWVKFRVCLLPNDFCNVKSTDKYLIGTV